MNKFKKDQLVKHVNGSTYEIKQVPDDRLLESCNEPFYEYRNTRNDRVWIRCKSETEDGRFIVT